MGIKQRYFSPFNVAITLINAPMNEKIYDSIFVIRVYGDDL
jgi:hypothetical protein